MSDQNVDYHHPAYGEFLPEWELVADCVDGERKIKKQGKKYLPHPSSDSVNDDPQNERYGAYLKRAAFINATGRTLSGLLGIAFNKTPKIELSGSISELVKDSDGEGQPLEQFIRDALSQTLKRGRAGILTDYTGCGLQTEAKKGRPVLRLFTAKQIINWRVTRGVTTLVVVKYEEPVEDNDNFTITMCKKWIELRLIEGNAHARHWVQEANGFKFSELIPLTDASGKALDELPFSWIGSSNNDHTPDSPPLSDIAYVNIKHYQAEADIAEAAHTVGQPMVAITGLTDDWADKYLKDGFTVGSRKGVLLPTGGNLAFAQPEDRNLVVTIAERREKQMAMLGAKLVERNSSARTATQASDEAQTDNSILSLCAGNVEQAINRALGFAVKFAGSGEGNVELSKKYDITNLDSQAIAALMAAVQSGSFRMIDFIRYQQRIGLIPSDEKPEDILGQLEEQSPSGLDQIISNFTEKTDDGKSTT